MELSLLIATIETTIPNGVTFNAYGVALRGLRYTFTFRKLSVTFNVCALNGLWGGGVRITTNLWGCGEPIMRNDFKFTSFEECTDYMWCWAKGYIERNKDNVSMEFLHFKVAMKKWFTLSSEEKFNLFKEVEFYGS